MDNWPAFEEKMKKEGLSEAAIAAFEYNFKKLTSGESLFLGDPGFGHATGLLLGCIGLLGATGFAARPRSDDVVTVGGG